MPRRKRKSDLPFWWRKSEGRYYVQVGGKKVRLSSDLDESWRLYHELMKDGPKAPSPKAVAKASELLVAEVCDRFLAWAETNKAPLTYKAYLRRLQHFLDSLKEHGDQYLPVSALLPYHVTRAADEKGAEWSNTSKNDLVGACQRAFNWAKRQGLVDSNPLTGMEKPPREDRELAISPAQYEEVLEHLKEPSFRDLLRFAWESGGRPQEIVRIEARFVQLDQHRVVFPARVSKGKKVKRVVYLTPDAEEILRPLLARRPSGPVFRTARGTPWNNDSVNNAFVRLRRRLGRRVMKEKGIMVPRPPRFIPAKHAPGELAVARRKHLEAMAAVKKERKRLALEHGPELHLGAFRKGYCTEALKNGLDTVTVSALMGHANAVMVSRVYAKVSQDPKFMAEAAKRARGQR